MSEIVLVTKNDEPALAFGEYEISADGKTLYVGSAGVSDGSSEVIYKGISPAKVRYGVFSRLSTKSHILNVTNIEPPTISNLFTRLDHTVNQSVTTKPQNVLIRKEFTRDAK